MQARPSRVKKPKASEKVKSRKLLVSRPWMHWRWGQEKSCAHRHADPSVPEDTFLTLAVMEKHNKSLESDVITSHSICSPQSVCAPVSAVQEITQSLVKNSVMKLTGSEPSFFSRIPTTCRLALHERFSKSSTFSTITLYSVFKMAYVFSNSTTLSL